MTNDMPIEARNKAGGFFREGYNCAESIFLAMQEMLLPGLDRDLVRAATAFGGGLGHAGCMCGALSAAIMILSLLKGRTDPDEQKREAMYEISQAFHDRFLEEFGATCCRVLNTQEFYSPGHLRNCIKITGNTAKILTEFILEKDLPQGCFPKRARAQGIPQD